MHLLPVGARALVERLRAEIDPVAATLAKDRDVMVAPPDILIPAVAQALAGSSILLGAQNMHFEDKGAFTGEVSPPMLQAYGVTHVILGHSERRHIFHETDELINKKVLAALHHRMTPILCVGETQDEHDSGRALDVVLRQLQRGLEGVSDDHVTAWRLRTSRSGRSAPGAPQRPSRPKQSTARFAARSSSATVASARMRYGFSTAAASTTRMLTRSCSKPDIDGALVGGASLKADSFARIVRAQSS